MLIKLLILSGAFLVVNAQKTPISIFYESDNSKDFFTNQLKPAYKEFENHIELDLIPFGNITYSTNGSEIYFRCTIGPDACYRNIVHGCAIKHVNKMVIVDYIACLYENLDYETYLETAEKCANKSKSSYEKIEKCANSTEGINVFMKIRNLTKEFNHALVNIPTVSVNKTYDLEFQKDALSDFITAVCEQLKKPKPKVCEDSLVPGILLGLLITVVASSVIFYMVYKCYVQN